jgi:hypothetical protein
VGECYVCLRAAIAVLPALAPGVNCVRHRRLSLVADGEWLAVVGGEGVSCDGVCEVARANKACKGSVLRGPRYRDPKFPVEREQVISDLFEREGETLAWVGAIVRDGDDGRRVGAE